MLGAVGVAIWSAILHIIRGGFLGEGQLETLAGAVIGLSSGGWLVGIFGLLPGLCLGLAIGLTNRGRLLGIALLVAMALGYLGEIAFGYPIDLLGIIFYTTAPIQAVWFGGIAALLLKASLGLAKMDDIFAPLGRTDHPASS